MKHLSVPQYSGLTMDLILKEVYADPVVMSYLPEKKEIEKVGKPILSNLVYTVVGEKFRAWVQAKIEERNERLAVEKDLMISFDSEVAAAFNRSTHVS